MKIVAAVCSIVLSSLLLVSACGPSEQTPVAEPRDPGLESEWRLARSALRDGQHHQAVVLYQRVLDRAYARDDAKTIGDVGYEHALALLRNGQAGDAAAQVRKIRRELERRGARAFASLHLLEAVALYEADAPRDAYDAAARALAEAGADDGQTRARAHFVHGMLAADDGHIVKSRTALQNMGAPTHAALLADKEMLKGRLLLLEKNLTAASHAFGNAADIRQELGDYIGMAKAMAAGADTAALSGDVSAAADLYYRAGRSAAVQDDLSRARLWLRRSYELATQHNLTTIAKDSQEQLQSLDN